MQPVFPGGHLKLRDTGDETLSPLALVYPRFSDAGIRALSISFLRYCEEFATVGGNHGGSADENAPHRVPLSRHRTHRRWPDQQRDRRDARRERRLGPIHQEASRLGPIVGTEIPSQQTTLAGSTRRRSDPGSDQGQAGHHAGRPQTRSAIEHVHFQPLERPPGTENQPQKKRSMLRSKTGPMSSPTAPSGTSSPPGSIPAASSSSTKRSATPR